MKICLIVEGSYPYVIGGVAEWTHRLINELTEYEFILYTICANKTKHNRYIYKLPENVSAVHRVDFEELLAKKNKYNSKIRLLKSEKESINKLLSGYECDWQALIKIIRERKDTDANDLLVSYDFFNTALEVYAEKYKKYPFAEYYWNMRSLLLPLFSLIKQDIPSAQLYHSISAGYAGVVGSLAKYLYNKPFVLTEHGIYPKEREQEILDASIINETFKGMWVDFYYKLSKLAYDDADRVIALYKEQSKIQESLGCDKNKIKIIANGVSLREFSVASDITGKSEHINIGAVTRIVPVKDIMTMINSFSIVEKEMPNVHFYIMGPTDEDPDYYLKCKAHIKEKRIKNITFTGGVKVKNYLHNMDILVLTSISEGQPMAVLEGMACRKPHVLTDVGDCRALLWGDNDHYGQAGFILPRRDYAGIAQAIIKLAKDGKLRKNMGCNGYRRALQKYTLGHVVEKYREVYKKYLGRCNNWRE